MNEKLSAIFSDPRAVKFLLKTCAKAVIDQYQQVKVAVLRGIGVIDFPVPPNSRMRGTSSSTIRHYYESGLTTSMPIITAAQIEGIDLRGSREVLDFGCGVGRQLLHITRAFPQLNLHACDVNGRSIEFIRKAYPNVKSYTSDFRPPLKYADSQFDMIYSVSIFSHLNIRDNGIWLRELGRITRPGGLCCLTVMGAHAIAMPTRESAKYSPADGLSALEKGGFIYQGWPKPDYEKAVEQIWNVGSNLIGIDDDYGTTHLSERYIRQYWNNDDFEVRQWIPGIIGNLQDLVVLRKK